MINLPVKCGEMYIKFDESGKPEYGFKMNSEKIIGEFVRLQDKLPTTIVLPKIEYEDMVVPKLSKHLLQKYGWLYRQYVKGNICLAPNSFSGIKNATIVVPNNTSIMLDWGAFEDNSNIEFILPPNLGLKQIYRMFDSGFEYERENWTLIAQKNLKINMGSIKDHYDSTDFTPSMNRYVRFSINPYYQVINGKIVSKNQTSVDDISMQG